MYCEKECEEEKRKFDYKFIINNIIQRDKT